MKRMHALFGGPLDGAWVREDPRQEQRLWFADGIHYDPNLGKTKLDAIYGVPTYIDPQDRFLLYRWHDGIEKYVLDALYEEPECA